MTGYGAVVRHTRFGAKLNTVEYMRSAALFEGESVRSQYTRFWLLLNLASSIATAGIVANSTATVIGAMIVAPLMRPIQGTMLATVLGDRRQLARSIGLMCAGALAAVGAGFILGLIVVQSVTAETNDQIASRVFHGLVDLFAALATGAIVMAIYGYSRLRLLESEDKNAERRRRAKAYVTMAVLILLVSGPLAYSTAKAIEDRSRMATITDDVEQVTAVTRWSIISITPREQGAIHVLLNGTPPLPDMAAAYERMEEAGIDADTVIVEFVPSYTFDVEGERDAF